MDELKKFNKKIMQSRYAVKMVDSRFYSTISVSGEIKNLTEEQIKNGEQGYIYVPYVLSPTIYKPSKEYEKFMKKYRKAHAVCPKCGSAKHTTTLIGFPLYMERKEDYKDLNKCNCIDCGHSCTSHELISKKEFKNIKNGNS